MKNRTYVGLDVHAKSISIAVILPDGELLEEKIPNRRQAVDQEVFEIHVLKVERVEEQLRCVDERLLEISEQEDYLPAVSYLRCFRGIERLTAMTLVCELYSFGRFASAPGLMNFVGLVVGERSSGERRRGTGITKAGNSHVRRVASTIRSPTSVFALISSIRPSRIPRLRTASKPDSGSITRPPCTTKS